MADAANKSHGVESSSAQAGQVLPTSSSKIFCFSAGQTEWTAGKQSLFWRASETSEYPHGAHFSITWMRWNGNRNWKTCLATAERRPTDTIRSHWNLAGHSVWRSINIPKQPWQKPTVHHQQQSLSCLRCWRNGTPPAALTRLLHIIWHKTTFGPCLQHFYSVLRCINQGK